MNTFNGFSKGLVDFYKGLEANNTKVWFENHRSDYEEFVKGPAEHFVCEMGENLSNLVPNINAIPKVNKSLFRINRDTRFSNDKRPYKTNMGIWFWEGDKKRMECPGFYFHYGENRLMLGAGIHMMPKDVLEQYRKAVVHKKYGPLLKKVVDKLRKDGYNVGEPKYKRVPVGFEKDHPNVEYLLWGGCTTGFEIDLPKQFFSREIIQYSLNHFKKMLPLQQWLKESIV